MLTSLREKFQDASGPLFSAAATPEVKRAERWLTDRLTRAKKSGFFIEPDPVLITPALAEIMLKRNTANRPLRPRRVERFASILRAGRWIVHLQGVSFDTTGKLDNGQHRLEAIRATGQSAPMVVAFGQAQEAFLVIDTHGVRTGADTLHIRNESYSTALAAAARMLKAIESGAARGNNSIDNDELIEFLDAHPALRDSCKYSYAGTQLKAPPTPFIVAHYLISQANIDVERINLFFSTVGNGLGLTSKRDPIYTLRKAIADGIDRGKWGARTGIAASIIVAWNAWIVGKRLSSVAWVGATFPTVEK